MPPFATALTVAIVSLLFRYLYRLFPHSCCCQPSGLRCVVPMTPPATAHDRCCQSTGQYCSLVLPPLPSRLLLSACCSVPSVTTALTVDVVSLLFRSLCHHCPHGRFCKAAVSFPLPPPHCPHVCCCQPAVLFPLPPLPSRSMLSAC